MKRRDFLRFGVAASATLAWPPARAARSAPKSIVIVGGGLAGLCAAFELRQAGADVVILEARARPGGRVHTLREAFDGELHAEAGAARIPDNHLLTIEYARRFDLPLVPFAPDRLASAAYLRGRRLAIAPGSDLMLADVPVELSAAERNGSLADLWRRYVTPVLSEIGDPTTADWPPAGLRRFDAGTFAEFLRTRGASPGAVELLELPYYKPADDRISALWWLREAVLLNEQTTAFKIRGGNDLLPRAIAARLGQRVRYGAAVVRIEQSATDVQVIYDQDGHRQRLIAERVLCTIPTRVLSRIDFAPRLSAAKRAAIEQQTYESASRVFVQCRERIWQSQGFSGFAITDHPDEVWHPTHDQPGARGLLVSYLSGAQSRQVTALEPAARVSATVERLEALHPGVRQHLQRGTSYCWDEDPWARGAYSILTPGQLYSVAPHLARPEGRLHFAGEHTSPWPGWMQGALASGRRAAQEIQTVLALRGAAR